MKRINKILKVCNLGFKYHKSEQIFESINFEVNTNEILCLLGPNGCGKTTLLNCLIGLNKPNHGEILIDNIPTSKMSEKKLAFNLGYVPQTMTATFDYEVIDYVVCGVAPYLKMFKKPGKKEYDLAWESLKIMEIEHIAHKSYAQISGGEQQLVSIARVLTQKPDFVLLDEPTSHLDFGNQIKTLKIIKSMAYKNFGIIMTTHNPDHALMIGQKTVIMKNCGDYTYGKTLDVVTEDKLRDIYGIKLYLEMSQYAKRKTCVAPNI